MPSIHASLDAEIARLLQTDRSTGQGELFSPWRFHDLRRTFASGLGRLGFPGEVIERSLNHVSGKFAGVAGVYQRHGYIEEARAAQEAWGRWIGQLSAEKTALL